MSFDDIDLGHPFLFEISLLGSKLKKKIITVYMGYYCHPLWYDIISSFKEG